MRLVPALYPLLLLPLHFVSAASDAHQRKRLSRRDINDDLANFGNSEYTAILMIGNTSVNVQLDTGSLDLWLNPIGGVGAFEDTGVPYMISYGDGSAYINGTIGLAEMVIAGQTIPRQAFVNVTQNVGLDDCGSGVCGLVGLSFDNPGGGIEGTLTAAGLDGTTLGKSVLSSVFDMNPDQARFFAVAFSRLDDVNDTADASLAISEYDPRYADVQHEPQNPTYPPGARGWSILGDGIFVDDVAIPWPSNTNTTPVGKNRIGLDTGTTNFLLGGAIRDAIYSAIPGAVLAKNSSLPNTHWSSDNDVWVVPCNTSINFTTTFGGHAYPIHPLDMTDMVTQVGPDGINYTFCVGTVTNGGGITDNINDNDALFGDSFLRNVYTVFSFGDNTTDPSIQFLALTDATQAADDFARVRQQRLTTNPPEISPAALIALFDGPPSASFTSPSAADSGKFAAALADTGSGTTTSQVAKYAPAVIGLLAVNLCLLLFLLVLGVANLIRGARKVGSTRSLNAQYAPVGVREDVPASKMYYDHSNY
ncbi:aspartic peptidase domain-containing protein [Mycena latifolia]|nr:aspartic peptidase domain-containing protein [Mycena latifolia]